MSLAGTLVQSTVLLGSRLVQNFVQPVSCLVDIDVGYFVGSKSCLVGAKVFLQSLLGSCLSLACRLCPEAT